MGKRERQAGHNFELDCVKEFKKVGYSNVASSRSCNRLRDAQKIDLANADEDENGRLPYNVQCKNYSSAPNYVKLLKELRANTRGKGIDVVLHKSTKKSESGRFLPQGKYAILNMTDFFNMVGALAEYKELLNGTPSEYIDKLGL